MLWGSHSGGRIDGEIFYADLRVTNVVFANEWDKQLLLTELEGVKKLFSVRVYAFCVLDDSLRLLLGGIRLKTTAVRVLLSTLLERYVRCAEKIGEYDVIPDDALTTACIIRLEDQHDVMQVLRYIHLTPSADGYVLCAADYWWTSYNTYRGRYCWQAVDAAVIMAIFEKQSRQAARDLMEYHRKAENAHNPVPACIRGASYYLFDWKKYYIPAGISDENLNETFGA